MKRLITLILATVLVFALSAGICEGKETVVTLDIPDTYEFQVSPTVSLDNGSGGISLSFLEYHSTGVIPITIRSTSNPGNTWGMVGDDGKYIIHYDVLDNNRSKVNPGVSFGIYPQIGMQFTLEVNESEVRKAPAGHYTDRLVFTIGGNS